VNFHVVRLHSCDCQLVGVRNGVRGHAVDLDLFAGALQSCDRGGCGRFIDIRNVALFFRLCGDCWGRRGGGGSSGSGIDCDEGEIEEVVPCSEGGVEVDGEGFVGFFISSAGFGSETCGPMKWRCNSAEGNSIHNCSQTCGGREDSARAPRINNRTWGLSEPDSSVSGVPGLTCKVVRRAIDAKLSRKCVNRQLNPYQQETCYLPTSAVGC
jgi:hypothetical protein